MPKFTRSDLWNYFVKVKEGGECKICHSLVKSLGTTTNLKKHMERRHPKVELKNADNKAQKTVEPKPKNVSQDLTVLTPKMDLNENESNKIDKSISSTPSTSFSIRQPLIHAALSNVESFQGTGKKAEQITNAMLFMIAKDDLPLTTSEKEGFQHLLKTIVPLYKAPTKKTIAALIDKKYEVVSLIVKKKNYLEF